MVGFVMRYLVILSVLFVAACQPVAGSASNLGAGTAVPAIPTFSPAQIRLGQTVYGQQCASCHGVNLKGQPDWKMQNEDGSFRAPPHDASGHTWHHGDQTLLNAVRLGGARLQPMNVVSAMPAYGELLSEEEMTAVLVYIKSTWPKDLQLYQWEATLREAAQTTE
ncbi:MAG: cytochrome c [Anaerolineae bacterium]|nr:cytochrome c [Anaerolineae bacterium]